MTNDDRSWWARTIGCVLAIGIGVAGFAHGLSIDPALSGMLVGAGFTGLGVTVGPVAGAKLQARGPTPK